jgi:hypothetical protein
MYPHYFMCAGLRRCIDADPEELQALIELFTTKDNVYPNGTSFAVTSEPEPNQGMRVYMSADSYARYLKAMKDVKQR